MSSWEAFLSWLPAGVTWIALLAAFIGRRWLVAEVEKGVEHRYAERLESFRADLQRKEKAIAALRDSAFGNRAQRQAIIDKRRIDAIERAWLSLAGLGQMKFVAAQMAVIKFDNAAKAAPHDPNVRRMFQAFLGGVDEYKLPDDPAKGERPFLSPLAWSYLSAYRAIVYSAYMKAKILTIGVEGAETFLDEGKSKALLKTLLPHQAEFIDKYEPAAHYYLLEELEELLLAELVKDLEGRDVDQAAVDRAAEINRRIAESRFEQASEKFSESQAR